MSLQIQPPDSQPTALARPPVSIPCLKGRPPCDSREGREQEVMLTQPHKCFADIYQTSPPQGQTKNHVTLFPLLGERQRFTQGRPPLRRLKLHVPLEPRIARRARRLLTSSQNPSSERFSPGAAAKGRLLPPVSRGD